MHRSKATGDGD